VPADVGLSEGHRPRRRFGQNFLVDRNAIGRIVAALAPAPDDRVVEIGPGLGALTEPLLERLDRLHAIEIDRDLADRLAARFAPERLVLHRCDALDFDFAALGPDLRVIGNLPYNISSPILFRLAACAAGLRDVTVMLQKEVVDRIVAAAGSADYGRLSVMLQYRFEVARLFEIGPGAFRPAPKVRSAVIRLVPRQPASLGARDEALFARVVAAAFGQRRKMLRNTIGEWLAPEGFAALGLDEKLRGEKLDVATYVRIANFVAAQAAGRGLTPSSSPGRC
jgi:16S rRNA (adenine1518-N6/adenine1519-N6)-dimethyltransferase